MVISFEWTHTRSAAQVRTDRTPSARTCATVGKLPGRAQAVHPQKKLGAFDEERERWRNASASHTTVEIAAKLGAQKMGNTGLVMLRCAACIAIVAAPGTAHSQAFRASETLSLMYFTQDNLRTCSEMRVRTDMSASWVFQ
jgi:hypothetical protein